MYSETALISTSDRRAAIAGICSLFFRTPCRNATSCASVYSENWPARRGYCAGMPAPLGLCQPAHAGTFFCATPPRKIFWPSSMTSLFLAAAGFSFWLA